MTFNALVLAAAIISETLQPFVDSGKLPGAICVLTKDGKDDITCVGYSDVKTKRPIGIDDAFMQCSQTKGFCGVTVAKLVEEGKISLDDPVAKYLPEFANITVKAPEADGSYRVVKAKNTMTIRNVMNHTAGFAFELPSYGAMGGWSRRMPLRSVAATAAAIPLLFEPGTKVQYSNVGIDIGAAIVEIVSGQRWEDYLKENVLDPLGMADTTFKPTERQLKSRIMLYDIGDGKDPVYHVDDSMQAPWNDDRVFASAGAGLWTTVRDQLKFYKMLMNLGIGENGARILKEETVKSILAVSTRPEELGGYSMGLGAPVKDHEDAWFGHGGAWGTNCQVNWHKKQLNLWVVQLVGQPRPWDSPRWQAADEFLKSAQDKAGADAYTGRMK